MAITNAQITMMLTVVNGLISLAGNLYSTINQIKGNEPIPTWEELIKQNQSLQEKIDAEKAGQ